MANKKILLGMLAGLLVFGLVFAGCDDGSKDDSGGGGGGSTLTVNNCPSGAQVLVCTNATVSTQMGLASAMTSYVATSTATSSPFGLIKTDASAWTGSGTYLVIITVASDALNKNAFKTGVSFSNGSATIDYNSMTKQKDLPAM